MILTKTRWYWPDLFYNILLLIISSNLQNQSWRLAMYLTIMSVCQYNTIRFYLKQNQKTHQKQYWPAINVSWTTFYVRPLICSIIVPTELTSPPQAKRGTEVIYFDIYIWFIKYTFAHLHYFYLLSPFSKSSIPAVCGKCHTTPLQIHSSQPNTTST